MKKIDFRDTTQFALLEDEAIDNVLDYDSFPPEEYKYFSKLAKLGYLNRHKNWSVKICEERQAEYKKQYQLEKDISAKGNQVYKKYQENIIKSSELVRKIYKSESNAEITDLLLQVIELLTNENGFAERISIKMLKGKKVEDNGRNVYFCPNCGGSVWQIKAESKFCFRCGQKLDWSKQKNEM